MTTTEGEQVTPKQANIRKALTDIGTALQEPENYDPCDLEEIRELQRTLEHRLTEEQETGNE